MSLIMAFIGGNLFASYEPGDTINVVHYDINISNINSSSHEIQAFTELSLTPRVEDVDMIRLELKNLTVDSVRSDQVNILAFEHNDPFLNIFLEDEIGLNDTISLMVYYQGVPFHESWGGYHFAGDYSFNLGVGISYIPHNLGKSWFPCVDDFTDRATYDVHVTLEAGLTAVCGGTLVEITDNGDNTFTHHWSLAQSIPTYLASVATGNYELSSWVYHGIEKDIPVWIYTQPGDTSNVAGSFAHLNDVMNIFETHFGAYRWDRVGYVGTAIGAMEHATNIAYPHGSINGTLSSEYLMVHELSHMWFGDLVTCDKAEEMWLNEGWATFCGSFYKEILYDPADYYEEIHEYNADVLQFCHTPTGDNGYFPLNEIPQSHTYGMTAYDRGATIVQSLRAYLGDDLFFQGASDYLIDFAFDDASSEDLRDALTNSTAVDMNGFFDNWVFNAGTPHYSIDSFAVSENGDSFVVDIYPRQKRKGPAFTGDDNIVEVTFMSENWESLTDTLHFDGKSGHSLKEMDFEAVAVFTDIDGKTCDATTDGTAVIDEPGDYTFSNTFFTLEVNDLTDSAFFMVTHNWVPPDSMTNPVNGLKLSDYRYWKIEGVFPPNFNATGKFFYSKASYLDNTLLESNQDSVIIMYRPDPSCDWQFIDFERFDIWMTGNLYVHNLQPGEYTLAAWDTQYVGKSETQADQKQNILVYPNPSRDTFQIEWYDNNIMYCELFDAKGHLIETFPRLKNKNHVRWDAGQYSSGIYYVVLKDDHNIIIAYQKLILE
ncbi:MAG: M1 family aminopeptidase [Bacteroidota bacterium]|nr:M1 family aminopeptidase [Bacteroidota bacterium]